MFKRLYMKITRKEVEGCGIVFLVRRCMPKISNILKERECHACGHVSRRVVYVRHPFRKEFSDYFCKDHLMCSWRRAADTFKSAYGTKHKSYPKNDTDALKRLLWLVDPDGNLFESDLGSIDYALDDYLHQRFNESLENVTKEKR